MKPYKVFSKIRKRNNEQNKFVLRKTKRRNSKKEILIKLI